MCLLKASFLRRSQPDQPQSHEEQFEQHMAENESGTEIQTSSTKILNEAIHV
jgi:hypothetical protein